MLKRIVATLVVKNGIVVQSRSFNLYMPVGKPSIAMEFLDDRGVDEIILLDISATGEKKEHQTFQWYAMVLNCAVFL